MSIPQDGEVPVAGALRNRVMRTYALCAIAESDARDEDWEGTARSIKAIRGLIAEITVLVANPQDCIPLGTIHEARELLVELESRIQSIESAIGSHGPFFGRRAM